MSRENNSDIIDYIKSCNVKDIISYASVAKYYGPENHWPVYGRRKLMCNTLMMLLAEVLDE